MHPALSMARTCVWALVLSSALAVGPSAGAAEEDWQRAMQAGDQALTQQHYGPALENFETAWREAEGFSAADGRRAETLVRLSRVYRAQGDFARPEALYQQALEIAEKAFGPESADYARYLHEAGFYFHTRRKYDRAEEYYRAAFGIRVRTLGKEHPEVAQSLCHLAVLYENQARSDKAELYYKTALEIREKVLGPDHPDTIVTLEHYARLLYKLNRGAEAQPMSDRAQAARRRLIDAAYSASGSTADGEIYRSTDAVVPPKLSSRSEPDYTEEARIARQEGAVVVQADISPDGRAGNVRLIRSLGLGLDEKAVEAVRQWEFEEARKGKQKVAFRAVLEIQFRVL
jgi:TonB family protein